MTFRDGWFYDGPLGPPMMFEEYRGPGSRPCMFCYDPVSATVAAVVAGVGSGVTITAAGTLAFNLTAKSFLVAAAGSLVMSGLSAFLAPDPPSPSLGSFASIKNTGSARQVRQPITERRLVYGEARVSGPIVFVASTDENQYLHMCIALASHEVEEIGEILVNQDSIPSDYLDGSGNVIDGKYSGKMRIKKLLGTDAQTADADLVSEVADWTSDHRLRGIAYIYVRMEFDRDVYPSGIPNFSAWVKGKKVLDTRDSTTKWTPNPALVARDYLTDNNLGIGAKNSDIDTTELDATANTCEEFVTTTNLSDTIEGADTTTNTITLTGVNDKVQYSLGDRVTISGGSLPGGLEITNLELYSNDFSEDNNQWTFDEVTITPNNVTAPNGLLEGTTVTESTGTTNDVHRLQNNGAADRFVDASTEYTYSIYIKRNTGTRDFRFRILDNDVGTIGNTFIDLSDGSVLATTDGSVVVTQDGSWYRVALTFTTGSSGTEVFPDLFLTDGTDTTYDGNGSSIDVYGLQLETGGVANRYIETGATTVSEPLDAYYVIPYQRRETPRIQLANSLANAISGNELTITSDGSGSITKNAEPRYFAGGTLKTNSERGKNLEEILSSMAGFAVYAGGVWRLLAGEYQTPTDTFDENDLAGAIRVNPKVSRQDRFNYVSGVYFADINDGNPSDYPVIENSTYQTADGETIRRNLDLPMTQRPHTAQRIAKIDLERSRQEIVFTAPFKLTAFKLQVGDNFYFSFDRYGWDEKVFEVIDWSLGIDGQTPIINITARENASAAYDWNNGEETAVDPAPNTNLPDPFTVSVVSGFSLDSVLTFTQKEDKIFNVVASWNLSTDQFVVSGGRYEVEFKRSVDTEYISAGKVDGDVSQLKLPALQPDVLYDVRIFAYNNIDVRSAETLIEDFVVGTTVTTNTEDWENETLARSGDDWENDTLTSEDWE